jgi:hypothetical protein
LIRGRLVLLTIGLVGGIAATAILMNWRRERYEALLQKLEIRFGQGKGDPNGLELIHEAKAVYAQRMRQKRRHENQDPRPSYDPEGGAIEVDAATSELLKELLTAPESYDWGEYAKSCATDYGIKLTFARDDPQIDVWLCLSCAHMFIVRADGSAAGANFDPSEEEMIAIAKRLFPNDPEIAGYRAPDLDAKRPEPAQ